MMMMFLKLETDKKTKKKYVNCQHAHAKSDHILEMAGLGLFCDRFINHIC